MAERADPPAPDLRTPAGRLLAFVGHADETLALLLGELRRYGPAGRPQWLVADCLQLLVYKARALAHLHRLARPTS